MNRVDQLEEPMRGNARPEPDACRSSGEAEPRWRSYAATDQGRQRENNEDAFLHLPQQGVFAAIDGVGGHSAGEVAANLARERLHEHLSHPFADPRGQILEAIVWANSTIFRQAEADPVLQGMACVLTVAVVRDRRVTVGHVGDTRLYKILPGDESKPIRQVTKDHSPVGERMAEGLSEREAQSHWRRNEIYRDVGSEFHTIDDEEFIDIEELDFEDRAALLLCTDGLTDMLLSSEILEVVEAHAGDPESAAGELIARANAAGGADNITVILVEGERFAEAVRHAAARSRPPVAPPSAQGRPASAPAADRGSAAVGPRIALAADRGVPWRKSLRRLGWWLLPALIIAVFWLGWRIGRGAGGPATPPPIRVVPGQSINDAVSRAVRGQTVVVAAGEYFESVGLRDGVHLVSEVPRAAVLRLPPAAETEGTADRRIAISAKGVADLRLEGFRVLGDEQHPLDIGLRLVDSGIEISGLEIESARQAAVLIEGRDRSLFAYSALRDNRVAVRILGGGPSLRQLLIAGSGTPRLGAVMIAGEARPQLAGNRFRDSPGDHVQLASDDLREEIDRWNDFAGRGQGVRVLPGLDPRAHE